MGIYSNDDGHGYCPGKTVFLCVHCGRDRVGVGRRKEIQCKCGLMMQSQDQHVKSLLLRVKQLESEVSELKKRGA